VWEILRASGIDPAPRRTGPTWSRFLRSQAEAILACDFFMDLDEQVHRVKFMIRDRGSNFTTAFDAVLADAGIRTVLCSIQTPRMNATIERWIGGCRRELLDRTLIWNQTHLRQILRQYETHHNQHRSHRSLHGAAALKPLPEPADLGQYRIRKQAQVGHDQRISAGRMTWTRLSAPTMPAHCSLARRSPRSAVFKNATHLAGWRSG
jgi:putative transposase